jgi:hypothetical protein
MRTLLLLFAILLFSQKNYSQNAVVNLDIVNISPDYYDPTYLLSYMDLTVVFTKNINSINGKFYMIPEGESIASIPGHIINNPISDYSYHVNRSNQTYYCDEIEIRNGNEVFIPHSNYFSLYDHYLKFETTYSLVFEGDITFSDNEVVSYQESDVIAVFETLPIPNSVIKSNSDFDIADVPNLGFEADYPTNPNNTRYRKALLGQEFIHFYNPVKDQSIFGENINVAIIDLKIYKNSLAYKSVVYDSSPIADEYFVSKEIIPALTLNLDSILPLYNHGTQMARYMLNYAPKINIYAMNKLALMNQFETNFTSTITNPNNAIDVVSLSGSYDYTEDLGQAIHDGLILNRSLGNYTENLNTFDNFENKTIFLPYYHTALIGDNRETATGAFVALQSVVFSACGAQPSCLDNHTSFRSGAGDAMYYTLSIAENGVGATSEATATFSGMVALMLEANKKNGSNYTPREIVEILFQTATDLGDPGVDSTYGWGAPNLEAALEVIKNNGAVTFKLYSHLPKAVAVTAISDDTSVSGTDGVTSDNTLLINGTAIENSLVEVFINDTSIGTTTTNENGNWTFDYSAVTLTDGNYKITAKTTGFVGDMNHVSTVFNLTIDTEMPIITCPAAITINTDVSDCTSSASIGAAAVTDNNSGVTISNNVPTSLPIGNTTVTWTAIDIAGNTAICTQVVTVVDAVNGCSDDDNDGVLNNADACPDTPAGKIVDANGCTLLAADNFSIQVTSETCPNKNNGQLVISAQENLDYQLTVNGKQQSFTTEITLSDLSPGNYEVCIEVIGITSPYCYTLEVKEGITLSGKSSLNNKKLQVEVSEGTLPYFVFVNGELYFETYENDFSLPVSHGDIVEVKTAFECEGIFAKEVQLFDNLTVYPNASDGLFTIAIPTKDKQVTIKVFNNISQIIASDTYEVINSRVQLDLTNKPLGVYFVRVYLDKEYLLKLVKK